MTLPTGERLELPRCVRIFFEVDHLEYATPATVSRCGMVYFNEDTIDRPTLYAHFLKTLSQVALDPAESHLGTYIYINYPPLTITAGSLPPGLALQIKCAEILKPLFESKGLVEKAFVFTSKQEHVMKFTAPQALSSVFSLVKKIVSNVVFDSALSLSDHVLESVCSEIFTSNLLHSI